MLETLSLRTKRGATHTEMGVLRSWFLQVISLGSPASPSLNLGQMPPCLSATMCYRGSVHVSFRVLLWPDQMAFTSHFHYAGHALHFLR